VPGALGSLVHHPRDAIVGSVVGSALAPLTTAILDRRRLG
jgi:hypothetical protein